MVPVRAAAALLCLCLATPASAVFAPFLFEPYEGRVVASVAIHGNAVTKDHVIWREIKTRQGNPFSAQTISDDYTRLENLGIFASIDVRVTESQPDGPVYVSFEFVEMPWVIPLLKFKYTEQNGWSVGPALSSVNMLGYGVALSGSVIFGGTTQFVLESRGPWFTSNRYRYDLRAAKVDRWDPLNEFNENSLELTPRLNHHLTRHTLLGGTIGYFEMKSDVDGITLESDNRDQFGNVRAMAVFDSRNSWRNPTSGWWTELELGYWFGDGNWMRNNLDLRRWQPLFPRHTLAVGALYSNQTGVVGEDMPVYLTYRMGGASAIRGYDVEVLGKDLYGQNQFLFTTEYLFEVIPLRHWPVLNWAFSAGLQLAAFADYGNGWDNDSAHVLDRGKIGGGFGLRFLVPGINVARVDVGFGEGGLVYLHFGVWDKYTAQRQRLR